MPGSSHYTIPKDPGGRGALILAVLTHVLLVVFLWIGVSWHSSDQGGVEAEVWDTQYREAAPKANEPEPEPEQKQIQKPEPKPEVKPERAKPDIALQQEKKRKEQEKKRKEQEKKREQEQQKKEEAKKQKLSQAEKQRREKERQENLRRMTGQTGTGGAGSAPRSTGDNRDPNYGRLIGTKIRSNTAFVVPANLDGNPAVEYAIELLPDGSLRSRPRLLKSSGLPGFDDAVLRAIEKSVPFPKDRFGNIPPRINVKHNIKEIR